MFTSAVTLLSACLAIGNAVPTPQQARDSLPPSLPPANITAIMSVPPSNFKSYPASFVPHGNLTNSTSGTTVSKRDWTCSKTPILTWGDADNGGTGVTIQNADSDWRGFYIYHNGCDAVPWKYIWINAGATEFVSLPVGFAGRIERGVDSEMLGGKAQTLASWFEFNVASAAAIWGDVSLIRGCDGGVLMWSLDNSGAWKGFTQNILDGAPIEAYVEKPDGVWVLDMTEGWDSADDVHTAVRDWELNKVGADYVYVDDHHGNPVIMSSNGRFGTYWPAGRP